MGLSIIFFILLKIIAEFPSVFGGIVRDGLNFCVEFSSFLDGFPFNTVEIVTILAQAT